MPTIKQIYQLKITLKDTKPPIWRIIQIPSTYTFWELHSAIQDAFGWTNSHLHSFTYTDDTGEPPVVFGIPFNPEVEDEEPLLAGWEHKINRFITGEFSKLEYAYDFGDDWLHTIELEEILPAEKGFKYPFCVDGARACPPEDCGGPSGYADLLEILANPKHEDHEDTKEWADSMIGRPFKPEQFYAAQVKFVNPAKRFKESFY